MTEIRSILNHLASNPEHGNAVAKGAEVREIMLQTGGFMTAAGSLYDIKAAGIGGGVYRLTLEQR
jgi:hypothetical protein